MGYDLDGDGYITPTELYNIFKAYFYLSMELVRDIVNTLEGEDEDNILDPTLNKSQSIYAINILQFKYIYIYI